MSIFLKLNKLKDSCTEIQKNFRIKIPDKTEISEQCQVCMPGDWLTSLLAKMYEILP